MDTLIERLHAVNGVEVFAFADDLVFASTNLAGLAKVMRIISRYTIYSGLGINTDKTSVTSTGDPSPCGTGSSCSPPGRTSRSPPPPHT